MKSVDQWLDEYGDSHKNATNKTIHWICIPVIMFTLFGLLWVVPTPWDNSSNPYLNWATLAMVFALLFYIRLSIPLFLGFLPIAIIMIVGNNLLNNAVGGNSLTHLGISVVIFFLAWVGQFIGHNIEGKKPSFFKDLQFLLIGPAWLLHFVLKRVGLPYKNS